MATIGENVLELAMLVKNVKRQTQLSETTIMRVVDMTFALAQQNRTPDFPAFEEPIEGEVIDFPAPEPTETED